MRMRTPHRPGGDHATATTFSTTAVTVGSLYLTTHSVAITAIGASAATAITAWNTWLNRDKASGPCDSGTGIDEILRADPEVPASEGGPLALFCLLALQGAQQA